MPLSTDVNLPREHQPVFPNQCIKCGGDPQNPWVTLGTRTQSWKASLLWPIGSKTNVRVPACRQCGWSKRIQRVISLAVTLLIAVLFMFFVWPYVVDLIAPSIQRWVAMATIVICLLPFFVWEI